VLRSSAETTSQGPHCRHCNFCIVGASPGGLTGDTEKYFDIFERTASNYRDDPYWNEQMLSGRGNPFTWHSYELSCPRCGWWASGVTNFNGQQFERIIEASLREFQINDGNLAVEEVISHVSKCSRDIYARGTSLSEPALCRSRGATALHAGRGLAGERGEQNKPVVRLAGSEF
jgi:hypothetical protein